ncbi:hypothetical protein PAXRUDRAFT_148215 [Paxillus rubicundulus Ve08.2h10]|uniref:Calcineurin-like phosphoesterase domain-containing protein n=1 Tax=Paxillus rubicundulus Ve08.2h10 TaxID=930991 RepID=A0A0D0DZ02_9AGAM|nr:hypothetical protein PAXRUDRAFT_148215 [Paxillus rubicundulus Ve08.2h10]
MHEKNYSIHTDVEGTAAPPHPGPGWTRFVCISDTHSRTYPVPSGDVLLHAGDLSSWGTLPQLATTVEWLKSLDHPVKLIVAGNHDVRRYHDSDPPRKVIQRARAYVHSQASFGMYYLEHMAIHVTSPSGKVWKLYGSPAAPVYVEGAFQYASRTEAKAIYSRIPDDTDILITHTPPYKTLDKTKKGSHAGCQTLSSRLEHLKHCRLHVFGHIHEAAGAHVDKIEGMAVPRVSINAAMERSKGAVVIDLRD